MRPVLLVPLLLLASASSAAEAPSARLVRLESGELGVDPEFAGVAPAILVSPTPAGGEAEAFAQELAALDELYAVRVESQTQVAAKAGWTAEATRDALFALKLQYEIETLRLRARHAAAIGHEELAAGLSAIAERMETQTTADAKVEVER